MTEDKEKYFFNPESDNDDDLVTKLREHLKSLMTDDEEINEQSKKTQNIIKQLKKHKVIEKVDRFDASKLYKSTDQFVSFHDVIQVYSQIGSNTQPS